MGENYIPGKRKKLEREENKEALFINAQNPGKEVNRGKLLNLEKGITLDPI